jgi:hypothetical protein
MQANQNETVAATSAEAEVETEAPVGRLRLLPSVTFGVRAAALARVALPVVMVAAGLVAGSPGAGAENLVTLDTTCCPPQV